MLHVEMEDCTEVVGFGGGSEKGTIIVKRYPMGPTMSSYFKVERRNCVWGREVGVVGLEPVV